MNNNYKLLMNEDFLNVLIDEFLNFNYADFVTTNVEKYYDFEGQLQVSLLISTNNMGLIEYIDLNYVIQDFLISENLINKELTTDQLDFYKNEILTNFKSFLIKFSMNEKLNYINNLVGFLTDLGLYVSEISTSPIYLRSYNFTLSKLNNNPKYKIRITDIDFFESSISEDKLDIKFKYDIEPDLSKETINLKKNGFNINIFSNYYDSYHDYLNSSSLTISLSDETSIIPSDNWVELKTLINNACLTIDELVA